MTESTTTGDRPSDAATPATVWPAAFIAPMSHLDLTFMGTIEECLSRAGKVFTAALELLDSQPDFRFLLEYVLFLDAYRDARPAEAARLDAHIRAGRVELGAEWSGLFVTQEDEEDLIRNVLIAKRYAREHYGLELETLQLTDIPGVIPQLPQLCAGLGIKNLVITRCGPPDRLFWYEAPNGSRVLVWSADGYNQAGRHGAHLGLPAMRERGLAKRLEAPTDGVPPLLYYGSDLYLPPPALAGAVAAFNAEAGPSEHLAITTPAAYFRALHAGDIAARAPVLHGALPSTWLYVEPVHAHVSRWDDLATRALDAAERLATLAWLHTGQPYPKNELAALEKALLLARDHNYGGKGAGSGQPRKLAERRAVRHRASVLLTRAMAAIAEQVEAPRQSVPVVVFNVLNWARTDAVPAHVSYYPGVDPTQRDIVPRGSALVLRDPEGRPVPYQVTADRRDTLGEFDLTFIARDVPGLGYTTYTLEPVGSRGTTDGSPPLEATATALRVVDQPWFGAPSPELVLDNGRLRLAVERSTGRVRLFHSARGQGSGSSPILDNLRLEGRHELPEVCQTPPRALSFDDAAREQVVPGQLAGSDAVRLLAHGPVLATVAVASRVLDAPSELRLTLYHDLPWMDLEARLDWDLRRFGRIELAYDVPLPDAQAAYGLPFGASSFGTDELLPGSGPIRGDEAARASWERTREICRWLDVGDGTVGVAMATDHRWTRLEGGEQGTEQPLAVRCCLVRGGRMRPLDPVADGDDPRVRLLFHFRFQPHAGSWQAAHVPRVGWEAVQPLLPYTVNDTESAKSLPSRQALVTVATVAGTGDALLTCLKPAEDGRAVLARWYEASGSACTVRTAFPGGEGTLERTDLLERPLPEGARHAAADAVPSAAWEIVTVRRPMGRGAAPESSQGGV